jgi:hypothetical protein
MPQVWPLAAVPDEIKHPASGEHHVLNNFLADYINQHVQL